MAQRLRIFISSPSDVPDERLRADLIVDKLSQDYSRFFTIESYRWEHEAMLASKHFQDAIEPPSAFDIVVLILWSRLGTPLPERTGQREYHGIDGRVPVTGTEWEYEEALKAARDKQAPDLLAFRNVSEAPIDTLDAEARARSNAQLDALDAFWRRHFVDRGVFLAASGEYRTLEEFAERLEGSLRKLIERRIKEAAAAIAVTEPIWLGEPFRGLEPYEFEHAPIFFGRDAAVMKATEQLAANARSGHAFLLVSGASGSGKSSLVKAGMLPRLMKPQRISGAAFARRTVFRPAVGGDDVFLGLATALTRVNGQDEGLPELIGPGQNAAQLATHLRGAVRDPGYLFSNALGRLTEAERKSGRLLAFEEAKLILVVDQFEELFTVSGIRPEDQRLFVQLLSGLARCGAVWVIGTLRADFWHRAMDIPELIALAEVHGRIDLAAASPAELAEMIRKPAQAAGLTFEAHAETGLGLDVVLAEHAAAAPGALPLLSFTLDEVYKHAKARGSSVLTHASYEALGGLDGAIASRADEIMAGLPARVQATLPRVLRALTTVSTIAGRVPLARSAPFESFVEGSPSRILVDAFVAARLLVAGGEGGAAATVRLAHEALISRWQRAQAQLAADRRDLETRTLVEQQFGRWSQARGTGRWLLLLRNPDLANAVDLARRWGDELDAALLNFIKQSVRRARLWQTVVAAVALVFALLAGLAYWQRGVAEHNFGIALGTTAALVNQIENNLSVGVSEEAAKKLLAIAQQTFAQLPQRDTPEVTEARIKLLLVFSEVQTSDLPQALLFARQAESLVTALSANNPSNFELQREMADALDRVGDVLRASGDPATALQEYQRELAVLDPLASLATETVLKHRMWVMREKMGDVFRLQGGLTESLDYYNAALNKTALSDAEADTRRDVALSHDKVAEALWLQGKGDQVLAELDAALAIWNALAQEEPANIYWQVMQFVEVKKIAVVTTLDQGNQATRPPLLPDFILPASNQQRLAGANITGLGREQLRLARNEIFARHGRYFTEPVLVGYFSQFSWYLPYTWLTDLTTNETANVNFLLSAEQTTKPSANRP